jgi:TIR domain
MSDVGDSTVPTYDESVFISYARNDDIKPPFDPKALGWVAFFWEQLRWELSNAGLGQAELWLDRYEIEPAEDFTEKIDAALKKAKMLILILSPNWVQRPWCRKELERFLELKSTEGDATQFVVPVRKRDAPEVDIPEVLRNREGYRFFDKEPSGRVRDFYWRGLEDEDAYFGVMGRIRDWITSRFFTKPPKPKAPKSQLPSLGRHVYIAIAADELGDARQRLMNDLTAAGYGVLPTESRLPDNTAQADKVICEALDRSETSVHLLGESEGVKLEGGDESIVRRQLRLAREHALKLPTFPKVLWAPKWVPDHQTKRDPFEVVARFGPLVPGEEVYAEEVTDLSQWLRGRLRQKKIDLPEKTDLQNAPQAILVAAAAPEDISLVATLANRLQADDLKVSVLSAGQPMPSDSMSRPVALVVWGKAHQDSVDALLSNLPGHTQRVFLLVLPGGDDAAKGAFYRQGIYAESLDAVPPDRKSAREWLVRVGIVQSEERSIG